MKRLRNERGQVFVFTALAMVCLVGMTALVLDVGAWFRTKRQLQATADAAALAGAQALPDNPGTAQNYALTYAGKNGGGVAAANISITSTNGANDTIFVNAKKSEPGIFGRVLGVDVVDIGAKAKAIVGVPAQALYVAPMVVSCNQPLIKNCTNSKKLPQFNVSTTLPYSALGAPGAFGMINLNGSTGTQGSSVEAAWILQGYNRYLPTGLYPSDPGAKFSSNEIQSALQARLNTVLLFPVFKTLNGSGQNAQYDIIGWVGFYLTSYKMQGNNAVLTGYFSTYIAQGILAAKNGGGGGPPNYGVKSIQLIQ
jgi:Flp pilus assembly protein TadG